MQSSNRKSPEINLAELGLSERIGKGLEKLQHLMDISLKVSLTVTIFFTTFLCPITCLKDKFLAESLDVLH
ncbi:hypothetical protein AHAS_Ahas13G0386200 [Arachis hypogaea]